jgi:hypothetical protein
MPDDAPATRARARATRRRPLAPAELTEATAVYSATGSAAEAARAIGRDPTVVRRAFARSSVPERAALLAEALDGGLREVLDGLALARVRLTEALARTTDPREVAGLAAALADQTRALSTARLAHARLAPSPEPVATAEADPALEELAQRLRRALHGPPPSDPTAAPSLLDARAELARVLAGAVPPEDSREELARARR